MFLLFLLLDVPADRCWDLEFVPVPKENENAELEPKLLVESRTRLAGVRAFALPGVRGPLRESPRDMLCLLEGIFFWAVEEEEGRSSGQAKRRAQANTKAFARYLLVQFDVNNHGSGASIYEVCDRGSRELCCCDVGVDRVPRFDSKTISCLLPRGRHPCLSHSSTHRVLSTEAAPQG